MAIQMIDIANAVKDYTVKVKVTVGPAFGPTINPGEKFRFSVEVANPTVTNGGVSLSDGYLQFSTDWTTARFIVPPQSVGIARAGDTPDHPIISPGTEVKTYHLFSPGGYRWSMAPGAVINLTNLQGIAKATDYNQSITCTLVYAFDVFGQYAGRAGDAESFQIV